MGNYTQDLYGVGRWWRHVTFTTAGDATLLPAIPGKRAVIEGYQISLDTTAGAFVGQIRNNTATTTIGPRWVLPAATPHMEDSCSGMCIPMTANDVVEFSRTGNVTSGSLLVWGRWISDATPLDDYPLDPSTGSPLRTGDQYTGIP